MHVVPTATTDRVCMRLTTCRAGQFVSQPATPTTDRQCQACAPGTVSTGDNANQCDPCASGTFTTLSGQTVCAPATSCPHGTAQSQAPTASSDRVCQACVLGVSFAAAAGQTSCTPVSTCAAGERRVLDATLFADIKVK